MVSWIRSHARLAAVAAVAVVMTLGLVGGGVMAQTPPAGTPAPGKPAKPQPIATATEFFNRLAAKLGLDAARVQTAAKEVQKEQIDAAVAAGRLTPEMATRLKERVDAGDIVLGHGPGGKRGPGGPGRGGAFGDPQALATWLGITPEQLRTELHEGTGKSLAQVAQAHGKTRDALIAFLTDQTKTQLDQAVAAGRLTRQQADEMLARFQQNVGAMVDRVHPAGGPGQPGGPRGPRAPQGTPTAPTGSA
jgi:hypothetical protein